MFKGDFHTHSTYDDGKSSLSKMAEAARALGMSHFGFSGHSWCPWQEDFCIPRDRVDDYLREARDLQRRYAGQMEISVGMELDYFGERPEGLDYVIGSVHMVVAPDGRRFAVDESPEVSLRAVEEGFDGDWYRFTDAYFDLVADLPRKTGCQWIGHFDLVSKFNQQQERFDEENPRYLRRALEAMEHLVSCGVPLEINTGAVARGYRRDPYPSLLLLRRLREMGGEIIINSDAHHASQLCFDFARAEALALAAGFTHRHLWTESGFVTVALGR